MNLTDKKLPESVKCPYCLESIQTESILTKGFICGRPQSRGGPYYKFKCSHCHNRFECHFEDRVITRKADAKKVLINGLKTWCSAIFAHRNRDSPARPCVTQPALGVTAARNDAGRLNPVATEDERCLERQYQLPLIFRVHPELLLAFRVLGLHHAASVKEIKERYKKLVSMYHPDKAGRLTEHERHATTKKLVEITKAYGTIRHYFM